MVKYIDISEFIGKTLTYVEGQVGGEEITFTFDDGTQYRMYHEQDCCERVSIDDINGDWSDIIGGPILLAEERTSGENPPGVSMEYQDSFTWTFYTLRTVKGTVDIRWYGESNGYYSESVSITQVGS